MEGQVDSEKEDFSHPWNLNKQDLSKKMKKEEELEKNGKPLLKFRHKLRLFYSAPITKYYCHLVSSNGIAENA